MILLIHGVLKFFYSCKTFLFSGNQLNETSVHAAKLNERAYLKINDVPIMASILGPKCFLSSTFFIISILTVYGVVGSAYNYLRIQKLDNIGEWPFNVRPLFFALVSIQILFPIVGFFAALAACKKRPLFLFGSGSILLAVFTCSYVFGTVSYQVSPHELVESYYKTFRGGLNDSRVLNWVYDMQWQHRCCGVYSYTDWLTADKALNLDNKIPSTCCRHDTLSANKNCGTTTFSKESNEDIEKTIHSQGCGLKLANMRREILKALSIELWVSGGISFCVAIFIYIGLTRFFVAGANSFSSDNTDGDNTVSTSGKPGSSRGHNDENNNNLAVSGNSLYSRNKRTYEKRMRNQNHESLRNSMRGPYTSINSQVKFGRSSSRNVIGNISKSKSFIIGDAPSNLLTPIFEEKDPEVLRKNVDMLWYQTLDKNMSTLSTTPIDISSMLLPGMSQQNKRTGLGCEAGINDEEAQRNTVYTLVSERPCTASLSQNCGSSFVNNNSRLLITGGEPVANGQSSPSSSGSKQQRQRAPEEVIEQNEAPLSKAPEPDTVPAQVESKPKEEHANNDEINGAVTTNNGDEVLTSQQQANGGSASTHQSQINAKYANPTSAVRSTTLSTIDEESESTKGSPIPISAKGASPASGSLTPETVTPRQTRTDLCSVTDKEATCIGEVKSGNNNNRVGLLNTNLESHFDS